MKTTLLLLALGALVLGACASTPAPVDYSAGGLPPPGCTSASCVQQANMHAANWYSGA